MNAKSVEGTCNAMKKIKYWPCEKLERASRMLTEITTTTAHIVATPLVVLDMVHDARNLISEAQRELQTICLARRPKKKGGKK